jgi:DNA-binding IclR family transcriptional regulator
LKASDEQLARRGAAQPQPTQSVERALTLLDVIGAADRSLTLTDIARRAGIHISTCTRLLRTLEASGLVARDEATSEYRLGHKIFTLAHALERQLDIRALARPVLQRLTEVTGEMSSLAMLHGDEVMLIERSISRNELGFLAGPGARAPLYCTAAGKMLLAHAEGELVDRILAGPLPQLTPTTITAADELRLELAKIRAQGYAIDQCERENGLFGVAAPVRDVASRVIAVISFSGPAERINTLSLPAWTDVLCELAAQMSIQLGWVAPGKIAQDLGEKQEVMASR